VALLRGHDLRAFLDVCEPCCATLTESELLLVDLTREFRELRYHAAREHGRWRARASFEQQCEQEPALLWASYACNLIATGGRHDRTLRTLASIAGQAERVGAATQSQLAYARALAERIGLEPSLR